ncbi:MAG TPA: hypothetical protein EYQ00_06135 [Dehalococcoidia bacterium]|nr:hypothetical protein [Dehalococcoidia bacterium]
MFQRTALIPRLGRLNLGLVSFGFGLALMLEGRLGLGPWEVFHQGISLRTDITLHLFQFQLDMSSVGIVSIVVSAFVMFLWLPLKERPGLGTVLNALVIGLTIDLGVFLLPTPDLLVIRFMMMLFGPILVALGTVLYIGANMGSGPRDGLMTGLAKRGVPIALARTSIEIVVLVCGFLLGGSIGLGTLWFAFGIGPLIQVIGRYGPFDFALTPSN